MEQLYVFLIKMTSGFTSCVVSAHCGMEATRICIRGAGSLQRAQFSLETRTSHTTAQMAHSPVSALFVVVAAFVTFVDVRIQPTLPDELLNPPTPTPRPFVTPFVENAAPTPRATCIADTDINPGTNRHPTHPAHTGHQLSQGTTAMLSFLDVEPLRRMRYGR